MNACIVVISTIEIIKQWICEKKFKENFIKVATILCHWSPRLRNIITCLHVWVWYKHEFLSQNHSSYFSSINYIVWATHAHLCPVLCQSDFSVWMCAKLSAIQFFGIFYSFFKTNKCINLLLSQSLFVYGSVKNTFSFIWSEEIIYDKPLYHNSSEGTTIL